MLIGDSLFEFVSKSFLRSLFRIGDSFIGRESARPALLQWKFYCDSDNNLRF